MVLGGEGRNEHRLFWGCPWPLLGPQAGPWEELRVEQGRVLAALRQERNTFSAP